MRILTLFPPLVASCFRGPHLAPPLLTALLNQERGLSASYIDLNIHAVRRLLNEAFPEVAECIAENCEDSYTRSLLLRIEQLRASRRIHTQLELIRGYLSLAATHYLCKTNSLQKNLDILKADGKDKGSVRFYTRLMQDKIAADQADVYLLSVAFAEQLEAALVCAQTLREQGAQAVYLGGSQITLLEPDQLEQLGALQLFDKICTGYYEAEIAALVTRQTGAADDSGIYQAQPISRENVQLLPRVKFNRDEIRLYFKPLELPVLATKGCYWGKCTFCDYAKMAAYCRPSYLVRDARTIFREIVALRIRYPDANIVLISDGISPALYLQLCRLAIKNRIKINTWSYMLHSEQLTESFFATLQEAGVGFIDFGSESTCDRILELMGKPSRRETILSNFQLAKKYAITAAMNVIIDFPSITYAECQEVIADMRFLTPYVGSFNPQLFHLSSNTPIHELSESLHIVPDSDYCDTGHGLQCREFTTTGGMTPAERDEVIAAIGHICLQQRLEFRTSKLPAMPKNGENYMCLFDAGAFTFSRNGDKYLAVPSLRSEAEITGALAELINAILATANPLQCKIADSEDMDYCFMENRLILQNVLLSELIKLGLILYLRPLS